MQKKKTKNLIKSFLVALPLFFFPQYAASENEDEISKNEAFYDSLQKKKKYEKISDLHQFAPFSDVVIIQRRYLPKTKRFELSGSAILNLKNELFNNGGGIVRTGFYFTEQIGIELSYSFLKNSKRTLLKKLDQNFSLQAQRFIKLSSYVGGSLKWSPIYGKFSLFNYNITPFDLFFTINSGLSYIERQKQKQSYLSFGLGVGQIFPFSKSLALRWDFNWNMFRTESNLNQLEAEENTRKKSVAYQHNLFFSLGLSTFFPKAKYR